MGVSGQYVPFSSGNPYRTHDNGWTVCRSVSVTVSASTAHMQVSNPGYVVYTAVFRLVVQKSRRESMHAHPFGAGGF